MNFNKNILKNIFKIFNKFFEIVSAITLSFSTILIFFAVLNRYILHFPIMWLNDLALFSFIFFALTAPIITTRERAHVSVDVLRQIFLKGKPRMNHIYSIFLNIIAIAVVGYFVFLTRGHMLKALKYPEYSTLIRWFNASWLRVTLSVAYVLIFINLINNLIEDIYKFKNKMY